MKIILIQPSDAHVDGSLKGGVWHAPPLGIASLAAFVRLHKHLPIILDLAVEEKDPKEICREFKPDFIGFSVTTPLLFEAYKQARLLKDSFPELKIIFGGPHSSTNVEAVLRNDFVDFVVFGEGEFTLKELLDSLPLSGIKGLAYKENVEIRINQPRELIEDLDLLPMPAYDLLNVNKYPDHPLAIRKPNISIITSRGCPFSCIYCNKSIYGKSFRKINYKNIINQMESLIRRYGVKEFQIVDDVFTLDKGRVHDFCRELLKRKLNIKWMTPNGVRAESLDEETLGLMKRSGCHYLYLGIESGSPKILARIKKGVVLEQIRKSVHLINKAGIQAGAFFMLGLPDETEIDIRKTIDFAKSLKLDSVKFGIMVPLPGTEIFDEYEKKGFIKNFDYSSYFWHKEPVFETDLISSKTLFYYYKRAYSEFYFRPDYILRKMLTLGSISGIRNIINGLRVVINNQLARN